jgi:hypothetical protein
MQERLMFCPMPPSTHRFWSFDLRTSQLVSLKTNELQRLNDVPQEDIIAFVGGPWSHRAWHTKGLVQKCPVSTGLHKFSLPMFTLLLVDFSVVEWFAAFFGQRMSEVHGNIDSVWWCFSNALAQISASWVYPIRSQWSLDDPLMSELLLWASGKFELIAHVGVWVPDKSLDKLTKTNA